MGDGDRDATGEPPNHESGAPRVRRVSARRVTPRPKFDVGAPAAAKGPGTKATKGLGTKASDPSVGGAASVRAGRPAGRAKPVAPPKSKTAPDIDPGAAPAAAPRAETNRRARKTTADGDHGHSSGRSPAAPAERVPRREARGAPGTLDADGIGAIVDPELGTVLVTGICGRLGRLLARTLHRRTQVIGVDRRAFIGKPKDVVHHQVDLRRKKTRDLFRTGGIRAVVHLGVLHDPRASDKLHHSWNVVAFQKLLEYMAQYSVPKLVVLSSANVYGPQADNPQFLTEEAPLLGAQQFRGIRDLVELDMLAQSFFWRHPQTETVVLRPCHILGAVRNAPSNYLRLERPMTLLGFDPMVQVVHERDVVQAVVRALRPGIRGIFNLRGPGELPLSRIFGLLGRKPRPVPAFVADRVLAQLWRYRMTSFPPPEIDHIRYLCMVDDTRAREVLGYRPEHDLAATLHAVENEP